MGENGDTRLAVFYIAAFSAVALCTALGAVGMALNWGRPAMLLLYAAAALFGVLAVGTMITYFFGGHGAEPEEDRDEEEES